MEEKRPREGRFARNEEVPEEEGLGASIPMETEFAIALECGRLGLFLLLEMLHFEK